MIAMRSLLTLVRVVGVLALVLVLYAWMYPAHLGQWLSREAAEGAAQPAAVKAPVATAAAAPAAASAAGSTAASAAASASASAAVQAAVPAAPAPAAAPVGTASTEAAAPPAAPAAPLPPVAVPKSQPVSKSQAAIAQWLGNKYRVSPAALESLIVEADKLAKSYKLSPNLIIAVMAIESNFHPYIQSEAGAQGLMQVMPRIHAKRYEKYGGKSSFIDPMVSLKVGAEILRDCVKLKDGSETEALRFYFGGGASSEAYIEKVRAEQGRLNRVAAGARVPVE